MTVTATPRLGLTRWSAPTDPFTRAQMDESHRLIDEFTAVLNKPNLFVQDAIASVPISVKAIAGATAYLLEVRDSADVLRAFIDPGGNITAAGPGSGFSGDNIIVGGAGRSWLGASVNATVRSTGEKGLVVKGILGHVTNLTEWQDSTGAVLARVNQAGTAVFVGLTTTATSDMATGVGNPSVRIGSDSGVYSKLHVVPADSGQVGATIRPMSNTAGDALRVVENTGGYPARMAILASGAVHIRAKTAGLYSLDVIGQTLGDSVVRFQGAPGQTASLIDIKDGGGADVFSVTAKGGMRATTNNGSGNGDYDHSIRTGAGNALNIDAGITRVTGMATGVAFFVKGGSSTDLDAMQVARLDGTINLAVRNDAPVYARRGVEFAYSGDPAAQAGSGRLFSNSGGGLYYKNGSGSTYYITG